MDGAEFREARVRAGLSVRKAAAELGVSASTIQRWQMDEARIPADAADRIRALAGDAPLTPAVAYALGRLYAALEHVLGGKLPGNMPTLILGDPAAGVATLLRLGREGRASSYHAAEDEIMAIMGDIPDFPTHLTAQAEGQFWLGYYAQKGRRSNGAEDHA